MEYKKIEDHLSDFEMRLDSVFKSTLEIGIKGPESNRAAQYEYGEPLLDIPRSPYLIPGMREGNDVNKDILSSSLKNTLTKGADIKEGLIRTGENSKMTIVEYARDNNIPNDIIDSIDFWVKTK